MKKKLSLLACLVLLGCLALPLLGFGFSFGNKKVPDDQLRDLLESNLRSDREEAELTDVEVVSSETDAEGINTVVADVTSETAFATYLDRYTLKLEYVKSAKKWGYASGDSIQHTPQKITPKNTPTVDEIPDIIEESQEEGRGLLRVGEDQAYSTIMPGYTVGEPVPDTQDTEVATLLVPLQVEGQRYGWLVFHGTLQAKLQMWSNSGKWQLSELTPGEGFAVTSVLDNRTFTSDPYELTLFGQDYPRQYTRTIHFGPLDWDTMSYPGTLVTVTNLSEGGEEYEAVEAPLNGYYPSRGNPSVTVSVSGQRFAMELPADEADTLREYDSKLLYTAQESVETAAQNLTQNPQVITAVHEKGYDETGELYTEYTVDFVYDAAGRLARMDNLDINGGYREYFYDEENRKTAEQMCNADGEPTTRVEYDENGNTVRSIIYGRETMEYTYDDKNRCTLATNHTDFEATYTYDDSEHTGTKVEKDLASGGTVTKTSQMTYDEDWRLLTEEAKCSDGEKIEVKNTYDAQGNLVYTRTRWDIAGKTEEETSSFDAYGNGVYAQRSMNGLPQWESSSTIKPLSQAKRT